MNTLEIAKKMEIDAIRFYTEAAEKTLYPAGKKMFETVAADEKRHLRIICRIMEGLDIHAEDVHPMERIKTVFEEMKDEMMQQVEATSDELEAFKIAMQMEREGIEFYRKLLLEASSEEEKILINKLIEEEEQHYNIFSNTYNFLEDTGNWFMWSEYGIVDGGTPTA